METPARHSFSLDGTSRVFPISSNLKGDNYCRLEVDGVIINDRSKYDIVNNSIVFNDLSIIPEGSQLDVLVVQSEEAIGQLAITTNIDIVAQNIDDINLVGGSISSVTTVANNVSNIADVIANIVDIQNADENALIASASATTATAQATIASTQAGIATTQATTATTQAGIATTKATEASASATSASASASSATTSATIATTKASEASVSASNAATSATSAASSATSATASASSASTSASSASTSASNALSSANSASTSATSASASESSASVSAATATTKATEASTSASEANTSATNAATSASASANSASTATTQAGIATTQATNAATSASESATSAINAALSASSAATSATSASSSASTALSAQTAAETARDQTLSAFDSFDDRYLGTKEADPTLDNDGNALVAGALYFNSIDGIMKVFDGSLWLAAYASLSGALISSNNLSDVQSVSTAQTNLGLGTTNDVTHNSLTATTLTVAGGTGTQGTMTWNPTDETVDLVLSPDVTLQIGQETVMTARNISGSTLTNGQVVKVTGASGDKITIDYADNTLEVDSSATYGVVTETINNNSTGRVTTTGLVRGLNTSTFAEGVAIWLGTNGAFTDVKPLTPYHLVHIGWVVRSHSTEGSILVRISNGWELEELHDVLITSPTNGQVLQWNATSSYWENATLDALPDQTSHSGQYLTTDGTNASWATLDTDANKTTKGLYEHSNTINADYAITSGNNAISVGEITIASGVTVTVPTGSRWVVL